MAERTQVQHEDMPPQIPEMPQEMGAMFGLLGMMQEMHETREQVREVHGGMGAVIGLLEKIVQQLEQPKVPPPPVATAAQMYPELHGAPAVPAEKSADEEPAAVEPASRRPVGWWGRLFPIRETHE
jgi:hypothetical protein